jgi:hypothetical protein
MLPEIMIEPTLPPVGISNPTRLPLVSVMVPLHDYAGFIEACLDFG